MFHQAPHPKHHPLRFYIVMTTVVIAGIFLILFMNNDDNFSFTTAAVVGEENEESSKEETVSTTVENDERSLFDILSTSEEIEDESKEDVVSPGEEEDEEEVFGSHNQVPFTMSFDQIPPRIEKDSKIKKMVLQFTDQNTIIKVNSDRLELNKIQDVPLEILDFNGKATFDGGSLSLDGSVKELKVNGVALSSRGEIEIYIEDLHFDMLDVDYMELKKLELPSGSGKLAIENKLQYTLENEDVEVYEYKGKWLIDKSQDSILVLDGSIEKVGVSGDELTWDLR